MNDRAENNAGGRAGATSPAWSALQPGQELGPLRLTVSAAANERYWRAAGADHPRLRSGALYPPIAANLTILCFQLTVPDAMIQTRQRLVCHRAAMAGGELVTTGVVADRYDKRGREYVDVEARIVTADAPDEPLWGSTVTFTPTAMLEPVMTEHRAALDVTAELVRAYSRRGNFHSDAETAEALGMPGLVAQGVQVAGPAYNILLAEWGDDFLERGELDLRFVGMVVAGETIEARVDIDEQAATIEVVNTTAGHIAVVGSAKV